MIRQATLAIVLAFTAGCDETSGEHADVARIDADSAIDGSLLADTGPNDAGPVADDADVDAASSLPDATIPTEDASPYMGTDLAVVAAHTLPTSLACGAATTASVTMRNTGDTTWSSAASYALQALNSEDLFLTSGEWIALGADVAPGGEVAFNLALSAPGAGTYPTQWRMVRGGVHAFGDVAASDVSVACDGDFRVFPAIIDGQFDMPAHEQRIASRDAALLRNGHVITGNDDIDNAVLGGGSPDGGIWLSGHFHFEIDASGQSTAASWISVFSDEHFPVTGGVYGNGEIHMGSPAGLDISGLFKNGVVTGYVAEGGNSIAFEGDIWKQLPLADQNYIRGIWHGSELSFVHGRMTGTGVVP